MKKEVVKKPAAKNEVNKFADRNKNIPMSILAKHFKYINPELCNSFDKVYTENLSKYIPRLFKGKRKNKLMDIVQINNIEILLFKAYLGIEYIVYPWERSKNIKPDEAIMQKHIEESLDIIIGHNTTQERICNLFTLMKRNSPKEKQIKIISEIQKFYDLSEETIRTNLQRGGLIK